MPHEAARVAETRAWFAKASSDLRAARVDLDAEPPLLEDAAFHCQQAAEKAMKGLLTWHDVRFRKTHDLVEVGGQVTRIEPSLEPLLRRAAPLSQYAWRYRYPSPMEEPTREETEEALAIARDVFERILERLPGEIRP